MLLSLSYVLQGIAPVIRIGEITVFEQYQNDFHSIYLNIKGLKELEVEKEVEIMKGYISYNRIKLIIKIT